MHACIIVVCYSNVHKDDAVLLKRLV